MKTWLVDKPLWWSSFCLKALYEWELIAKMLKDKYGVKKQTIEKN
jgi:hypothetical protein